MIRAVLPDETESVLCLPKRRLEVVRKHHETLADHHPFEAPFVGGGRVRAFQSLVDGVGATLKRISDMGGGGEGDRVANRLGRSPGDFRRTLVRVHNGGPELLRVFVEGTGEVLGEARFPLEREGVIDTDGGLLDGGIPERHRVGAVEAVGFQVVPDGPPGVEAHPCVPKVRVVLEFLGFSP